MAIGELLKPMVFSLFTGEKQVDCNDYDLERTQPMGWNSWTSVSQEKDFRGRLSLAWFSVLLMEEIRRSPVEVGSLSHYLHGFIHPIWCRISSINSMTQIMLKCITATSTETSRDPPNLHFFWITTSWNSTTLTKFPPYIGYTSMLCLTLPGRIHGMSIGKRRTSKWLEKCPLWT